MAKLKHFDPPANINDFNLDEEQLQQAFRARWSGQIDTFTRATLQNDPWGSVNQPGLSEYFDPREVEVPDPSAQKAIRWIAFPERIKIAFPNVGARKQWQYADEGPPAGSNYGPAGPRGWQDEYCEWSVTRNAEGKITRVDFTCENREYWYALWATSPEVVLRHYRELVGPEVQLGDLELRDKDGKVVLDPETGRPAYNDRNHYNSTTTTGAVHLISNPNALSAEIFLAGQATILRENSQGEPTTDPDALIRCSGYGSPGRNSDPHIGATVNAIVRGDGTPGSGKRVSLSNPVGLYIQTPNFQQFQLPPFAPAGKKASDYWKILRGHARGDGESIDYILHARFEVPEEDGFTVSDITIDGFNIDYGSQIAQTFQIALAAWAVDQVGAPPRSLRCADTSPNPLPRAYVMRDIPMLPAALRSGLNMRIEQGSTVENIGLYAFDTDAGASVAFTGAAGVTPTITGSQVIDAGTRLFTLTVAAAHDAPLGVRSVMITNPDGRRGPAAYGLIEVVPPGSLSEDESAIAERTLVRDGIRHLHALVTPRGGR